MGKKYKVLLIHVNMNIFRIILQPSSKQKDNSDIPVGDQKLKIDVLLSDAVLRKHFHMRYSNEGNKLVDKIIEQAKSDSKRQGKNFSRMGTRQASHMGSRRNSGSKSKVPSVLKEIGDKLH